MDEFPFAKSAQATYYCRRIKRVLQESCGLTEREAIALMSCYWKDGDNMEDDALLYHEEPYYYAMILYFHPVYGKNYPDWYHDERYWPIPKEWQERWDPDPTG